MVLLISALEETSTDSLAARYRLNSSPRSKSRRPFRKTPTFNWKVSHLVPVTAVQRWGSNRNAENSNMEQRATVLNLIPAFVCRSTDPL